MEFSQRLTQLFSGLRTELVRSRVEIDAYRAIKAEEFGVFDYISPDENRLSDIIADMLNPTGAHGQGDAFLRLFLANLDIPIPARCADALIDREESTGYLVNHRRRIDVLIDFGASGVGIENKPWANEQADQIADYFKQLDKRYGASFVLVYLSGSGEYPASVSKKELSRRESQNQFRLMTYETDLLEWLDGCIGVCRADRVKWFLGEFRSYIGKQFATTVTD